MSGRTRIVSQMEVSFRRYVSEVLGLRSAGHYLTSVRTAAKYLREKGLEVTVIERLPQIMGNMDPEFSGEDWENTLSL